MSSRDLERGNYLRRLFEEQLAKSDPKGSDKERRKEAEARMDKKLGKGWRDEINKGGVEFIQVEVLTPVEDTDKFYDKVRKLGDEEGLGNPDLVPEDGERPAHCDKERTIKQIMELLKKL